MFLNHSGYYVLPVFTGLSGLMMWVLCQCAWHRVMHSRSHCLRPSLLRQYGSEMAAGLANRTKEHCRI